jgi:hypothetical protein|tara:strand:- start:463 stop:744 length:282 start_codon:yes stop_codon:yes gene_type:complete
MNDNLEIGGDLRDILPFGGQFHSFIKEGDKVLGTVAWYDDSDEDCRRTTYVALVDGEEHVLAACAIDSDHTMDEMRQQARELFGADVELSCRR